MYEHFASSLISLTGVISDNADSNALTIKRLGVSAFLAPAAALINVAVFADYEVISDVGPSFRGHVIVLEEKIEYLQFLYLR